MRFSGIIFVLCIFHSVHFIHSIQNCVNKLESFYPKCNCTEENYGWSVAQDKCEIICPSISEGTYPDCECRFGDEYDEKTNSCPNPVCPTNTTADSVYPNCKCTEQNHEYSDYLNLCFPVCPENSTGRFPNCKCDDPLAGFSKDFFWCKRCPPGSKAEFLYPNCKSATNENATFQEYQYFFYECPPDTYGIEYDCHCNNGNIYKSNEYSDPYENVDELDGYTEEAVEEEDDEEKEDVNDEQEKEEKSDDNKNSRNKRDDAYQNDDDTESVTELSTPFSHCSHCPKPDEVFPNCTCDEGRVFDGLYCRRCPPDASGLYGECKCDGGATYVKEINRCHTCPKKSVGKYPKCRCQSESAVFVPPWGKCLECPENATGRFPNCICSQKDHIYSAYINECYIECGNGTGIHPSCSCGKHFDKYYDVEARTCKPLGYAGRPCPPGSVGIAPDCKCALGLFQVSGWGCFYEYAFGPPHYPCDKWPQCDLGIDRNTLLSLVG